MPPGYRRLIWWDFGVVSALVNMLVNGPWAIHAYRGVTRLPLLGPGSVTVDAIATCFLLPFVTGLLVTPMVRAQIVAHRLQPLERTRLGGGWVPSSTFLRSLFLGIADVAVLVPAVVGGLLAAHVTDVPVGAFIVVKTAACGLLGLVVTPLLAHWAATQPASGPPAFSRTRPPSSMFFLMDAFFLAEEAFVYLVALAGPALWLWSQRSAGLLALVATAIAGWLLAGLVFVTVVVCIKRGLIGEVPLGRCYRFGRRALRWTAADRLTKILGRSPFAGLVNDVALLRYLYYRGMGARIDASLQFGRGVTIPEPWLVTMGHNVLLGDEAIVSGHKIERDILTLEPVEIGDDVLVGARALILPGVKIGRGAVVGACSVVARGTVIPPGETWSGNPARKASPFGLQAKGRT